MDWFVLQLFFGVWQWTSTADTVFFQAIYDRFLELCMLALAVAQVIQGKVKR